MKRFKKKGEYTVWIFPKEGDSFNIEVLVKEASEKTAKSVAIKILSSHGFSLVNDDDLVMEVERVYETRWDCIIGPERVRQAA